MSRRKKIAVLVILILICLSVGWVGSLFTAPAIEGWYAGLNKPWFQPPSWIFGPVWTLLYILMAVAAWLIWKEGGVKKNTAPLIFFGLQLFFNACWSPLFFGLKTPGYAFADITALWMSIIVTSVLFMRKSRIAGLLMLPYLLWVSFAAVLNFAIWRMNAP